MAFKLNNPTDPPSGSTNATAEELRQKRMDANKALEAERKRVADIRSRIDQVAESAAGGSYTSGKCGWRKLYCRLWYE
jgi:hypothetical protein